jgi:hypothetical protein
MTAVVSSGGPELTAPATRQVVSVLRLASRVLGEVPAADARDALLAVRCFARSPTSAHYLAAVRVLRQSERRHKLSALGRAVRHRRTEEGLDLLARATELEPELVDALRALPPDARNRRRLTCIAELVTAQRLIEARASSALRDLQRALGPLPRQRARSPDERAGGVPRRVPTRTTGST